MMHITVVAIQVPKGVGLSKTLRELIWQDFYIDAKSGGMGEDEARKFASDQTAHIADQTNPAPAETPEPVSINRMPPINGHFKD